MTRFVVDTNVPVVANGRSDGHDPNPPSPSCRIAAIQFLTGMLASGTVIVDLAGEIQKEYRTYLRPSGQPGVGDRFYQTILQSHPQRIERINLPKRTDGEYQDLPQALIEVHFDPSDRKFAALAIRGNAPVVNATDSDWLIHRAVLVANGIEIMFLCGDDRSQWYETSRAR
ncbi:MAG: hypothetical protein WAS73_18320 [Defluviicoccus sp.]